MLGARLTSHDVTIELTEVEAYLGEGDPGSHAFRGLTPRTTVMFGPPAHLYTYVSYGMHVCANVVCSPQGTASAVLLRAGRVVAGHDRARERRATSRSDDDLARGPARLCVALGITLADNGSSLESGEVQLELAPPTQSWTRGPRTGVSGAGGTDAFPWRFWIPSDPTVSPYRAAARRRRGTGGAT